MFEYTLSVMKKENLVKQQEQQKVNPMGLQSSPSEKYVMLKSFGCTKTSMSEIMAIIIQPQVFEICYDEHRFW